MKNQRFRGLLVFVVVIGLVTMLATMLSPKSAGSKTLINNTEFTQMVEAGTVKQVLISGETLVGLKTDSKITADKFPADYDFKMYVTDPASFNDDMRAIAAAKTGKDVSLVTTADYGFEITTQPVEGEPWYFLLLPYLLIGGLLIGLWFIFMKQMNGTNNKTMNFGKSRHTVADTSKKRITFADVAGSEEEKEELSEIVEFLKNPKKFLEMGARIPAGVLLVGPPGTGKTLFAKAVAGEAGVPFFSISGSDFVEMYVGVGASRVRDLFNQAKQSSPCIVFIDEIDAVGRHRGAGLGGGNDEREQTLNQLLVEMDGFTVNEGIVIIAATNRPDILDPALLRPGRFDRQITVSYPDIKSREEILKVHSKKKPLSADVKLHTIAKLTPFFTGADLENLLNEAAILTVRRNKKEITMSEITEAITRVELGPEKKSRKVTEKDKRLVAFHEAGHALVAHYLPNCEPVHEISIIPRGSAGGYTQTLADEETNFITSAMLRDRMAMAMGGYAAESIEFGDITTGSSSDLKSASGIARGMVTQWGMNSKIGPVSLEDGQEIFVGRDFGRTRSLSEDLSARVDEEVLMLLTDAVKRARDIITEHRDLLEKLVSLLLEREKLNNEEFLMVIEGKPLPPLADDDTPNQNKPKSDHIERPLGPSGVAPAEGT